MLARAVCSRMPVGHGIEPKSETLADVDEDFGGEGEEGHDPDGTWSGGGGFGDWRLTLHIVWWTIEKLPGDEACLGL